MTDLVDTIHNSINGKAPARGIRISAELEPLAGQGAPVKSAIYSGTGENSKAFPIHLRPNPANPDQPIRCSTLLSDEASRNLAETALLDNLPDLKSLVIKQAEGEAERLCELPCDVLNLAHSLASTHLRMSDYDGKPFKDSDLHEKLWKKSGPFDASHLYELFPGFAISGFWFSNSQGKYPAQHPGSKVLASTRLPVVAFGIEEQKRGNGMSDPTVLATAGLRLEDKLDDHGVRKFKATTERIEGKNALSAINLGPIPPTMKETAWLTAERIEARGMISFDVLRRLRFPGWEEDRAAAALTTLATLVLASTVWSMDSLDLRAGCELTLTPGGGGLRLELVGRDGTGAGVDAGADLKAAVREADSRAKSTGIPSIFGPKEELTAGANLIAAIKNGEQASGDDGNGGAS